MTFDWKRKPESELHMCIPFPGVVLDQTWDGVDVYTGGEKAVHVPVREWSEARAREVLASLDLS